MPPLGIITFFKSISIQYIFVISSNKREGGEWRGKRERERERSIVFQSFLFPSVLPEVRYDQDILQFSNVNSSPIL
jgi:hypothetical protein